VRLLGLFSLSLGLKLALSLCSCLLRDRRVALGFLARPAFGVRALSLSSCLRLGGPRVSRAKSCVGRDSGETALGIFGPCRRPVREKSARDGIAQ
jgi:hypothetical protein